jgi:hypothetical protein
MVEALIDKEAHKGFDVIRPKTWDEEVEEILAQIRSEAKTYMVLGFGIYGLGSVAIMYFMRANPGLATATVMFFFQLCVIYFATRVIFPCISGAFRVGLLANRKSMPSFEKLAEVTGDPERSPVVLRIERAILDMKEEGVKIRSELSKMVDVFTTPIKPPPPIRAAAGVGYDGKKEGNGV